MISPNSIYTYKAKVTKIIDGDSIEVTLDFGYRIYETKVKVRLYGINTPEIYTSNKEEKERGYEAKRYVESQVPVGSEIYCQSILDKEGSFKRKLMLVYYQDENEWVNLNKSLVLNGLAELSYVDSIEEIG